uniref:Uncharacterized protein n=1 Tax=Romanomermis culicivorax TaxID=13658 RepID=A0A915ILG0_ROMCU
LRAQRGAHRRGEATVLLALRNDKSSPSLSVSRSFGSLGSLGMPGLYEIPADRMNSSVASRRAS